MLYFTAQYWVPRCSIQMPLLATVYSLLNAGAGSCKVEVLATFSRGTICCIACFFHLKNDTFYILQFISMAQKILVENSRRNPIFTLYIFVFMQLRVARIQQIKKDLSRMRQAVQTQNIESEVSE